MAYFYSDTYDSAPMYGPPGPVGYGNQLFGPPGPESYQKPGGYYNQSYGPPGPDAYTKPGGYGNQPYGQYPPESYQKPAGDSQIYRLENQGSPANNKPNYLPYDSSPFAAIVPSSFPPGTDPKLVECYKKIDKNGDGVLDDRELQSVLTSVNQSFDLRTVHLLMYLFTNSNTRMIGPAEFVPLYKSLQNWRLIFQRADVDKNGRIDVSELRGALTNLGYTVSPTVLNLLISKFDKSRGNCSLGFDNFIECCITVKGLTEKYRAKENSYNGTAVFTYDDYLLSVLPFVIA
ncbi:hypothetical protein Nepgr_009990 [Nepenthes gracilis]|uniref:EF-hand domain-containing protein n=1 Tax=Nepenthes gracilis TaxID=150966 RepID=A0AAD3SBG4_NEPGR|nr:hypothetical protein Nepgr_009990 [Nepenthes gracilis]